MSEPHFLHVESLPRASIVAFDNYFFDAIERWDIEAVYIWTSFASLEQFKKVAEIFNSVNGATSFKIDRKICTGIVSEVSHSRRQLFIKIRGIGRCPWKS